MNTTNLKIKFMNYLKIQPITPKYATEGSACMDLCAYIDNPVILKPNVPSLIGTGIAIELEKGYVGYIFSRSGLSVKNGIILTNGVGVIDSDYTGEIKVALINVSSNDYTINNNDRIAQLCIMPFPSVNIEFTDELTQTNRGDGGFGSTGV